MHQNHASSLAGWLASCLLSQQCIVGKLNNLKLHLKIKLLNSILCRNLMRNYDLLLHVA